MATLTETAFFARKGVNIFIVLIVLGIILRIVLGILGGFWNSFFPPKYCSATAAFGKLSIPNAQNDIATPSGLTYNFDTVGNSLPTVPPSLKVYFLTPPPSSFAAFDRMKSQAQKLGFTSNPSKTGITTWKFTDPANPLRSLTIDEVTLSFILKYNYASDLSVFDSKNFTSEDKIISDANSYFQNLDGFPPELSKAKSKVVYLKIDSGNLILTTSLSNADAIAVTLLRPDIVESANLSVKTAAGCLLPTVAKAPIVSPDARFGLISIIFSGQSDPAKKVVEAHYSYSPLDIENWATYPIIKVQDAMNKLKNGQAFFASLPKPLPSVINISDISVGYLDPFPRGSYLEPVYIFTDSKGFIAYVPAVSGDWLQ